MTQFRNYANVNGKTLKSLDDIDPLLLKKKCYTFVTRRYFDDHTYDLSNFPVPNVSMASLVTSLTSGDILISRTHSRGDEIRYLFLAYILTGKRLGYARAWSDTDKSPSVLNVRYRSSDAVEWKQAPYAIQMFNQTVSLPLLAVHRVVKEGYRPPCRGGQPRPPTGVNERRGLWDRTK